MRSGRRNLVQIAFALTADEGGGAETLWSLPIRDHQFRLQNTPLHVFGIGNEDVVHAIEKDGQFGFDHVVQRGGHSTYRIALVPAPRRESVSELLRRLKESDCDFEGTSEGFFAVDVPPDSNIHEVYDILQAGLDDGTWWFDEMHVGHRLAS